MDGLWRGEKEEERGGSYLHTHEEVLGSGGSGLPSAFYYSRLFLITSSLCLNLVLRIKLTMNLVNLSLERRKRRRERGKLSAYT
jgi:hypothetical protein